jgi:hypothetical protein
MPIPELRIVYLQYDDHHHQAGIAKLIKLTDAFFPKSKRRLCVVDNALTGNLEMSLGPDRDFISGDNSCRDFSGYDKGIQWLKQAFPEPQNTIWIFANDTFHRDLGVPTLRYFQKEIVKLGIHRKAFVGYADQYPREIELFGLGLNKWIRTHFFFLDSEALSKVLPLTIPLEDKEIFGGDRTHRFFKEPSPLSRNYRDYLKTWLFGKRDPSGEFSVHWRAAEKLTPENFEDFKAKTKAILSEHYLSARLQKAGVPIFPVNSALVSMFLQTLREPSSHLTL